MLCDFNKVFHPTEDDIKRSSELFNKIHIAVEEERKHIILVRCMNSRTLYHAEPLKGFLGDCETCKHYRKAPYDFVEGGTCSLHNISCGFGFVCENVSNDYSFDYKIIH